MRKEGMCFIDVSEVALPNRDGWRGTGAWSHPKAHPPEYGFYQNCDSPAVVGRSL